MSLGTIGNSYENYNYSHTTQSKTISHSAERTFMLPEDMTAPKTLGIGFMDVGGGISYGMSASYAANSTADNPIIQVKVTKAKDNVEVYEVNINDINVNDATDIEMFALCNYADDIGEGSGSTFGSWNTLKNFAFNAEYLGDFRLAGSMEDFTSVKQDWSQMVSSMVNVYMNAGIYKQAMDGNKLLTMFGQCTSSGDKTAAAEDLANMDYRKFLSEKKNEIYEKVKNNDTEVSYQIGGQSFTQEEWDKLLENFDELEDEIKKLIKEEQERKEAEQAEEQLIRKLQEAEDTVKDESAWMSMDELKSSVGV